MVVFCYYSSSVYTYTPVHVLYMKDSIKSHKSTDHSLLVKKNPFSMLTISEKQDDRRERKKVSCLIRPLEKPLCKSLLARSCWVYTCTHALDGNCLLPTLTSMSFQKCGVSKCDSVVLISRPDLIAQSIIIFRRLLRTIGLKLCPSTDSSRSLKLVMMAPHQQQGTCTWCMCACTHKITV